MTYSQNADDVERLIEPIQHKVSRDAPRDYELPNMSLDSPPDQWVRVENADCASDTVENLRSLRPRALQQKLDDSLEVGECLVGID